MRPRDVWPVGKQGRFGSKGRPVRMGISAGARWQLSALIIFSVGALCNLKHKCRCRAIGATHGAGQSLIGATCVARQSLCFCCAVVIADALLAVALAQVRAVVANVSHCSASLATMLLTLGQSFGRWSPSQHQHDCLHNTTKEYYEAGNKGAMSGCGSLEHRLLL